MEEEARRQDRSSILLSDRSMFKMLRLWLRRLLLGDIMRVVCLFDGSCLYGVDGAGAAVAYDKNGVELARRARYLRDASTTTNIAEYNGLLLALVLARDLSATDVEILGDSELVVRQFNGVYACRRDYLKVLLREARGVAEALRCPVLVRELPKAGPTYRRRHGNAEADALAGECRRARRDIP